MQKFLSLPEVLEATRKIHPHQWPLMKLPDELSMDIQTHYPHLRNDDQMTFHEVEMSAADFFLDEKEFEIKKGRVVKRIISTLCTGDDRCSASSFGLTYHLKTHYITVINDSHGPGLLKYDFDQAREVGFTKEDLKNLNCILRTELNDPESYLWQFEGVKKYDQPEHETDGITGATSLADIANYECAVPEGGLWTTLTVFAHAYEFGHQVRGVDASDLINRFTEQQNKQTLQQWTGAMTKYLSLYGSE